VGETRNKKKNHYFYKYFEQGSSEYNKAIDMLNTYNEADGYNQKNIKFEVTRVTAVYNKILVENFINMYMIQSHRSKTSGSLFFSKGWSAQDSYDERQWVYQKYEELVTGYPWNKKGNVAIVPAVHGTDLPIAEKICESGFAALSSLDEGFYGKGIYFTSKAWNTLAYIAPRRSPVIIFCWILPGNPYPVIENYRLENSLIGAAMVNGYSSHFVVTNRIGDIGTSRTSELFDEFVIPQESQIAPAFIFEIEKKNLMNLIACEDHVCMTLRLR